jgi:Tfp pilus assembly protein PilZ
MFFGNIIICLKTDEGEKMADQNIKIDYKKLNSFLKDYIRMMKRGWLFLIINDDYRPGDSITFNIKVAGLEKELSAQGAVIYKGPNEKGSEGVGLKFSFDEKSSELLSVNLKKLILEKYGDVWGGRICSLMGTE